METTEIIEKVRRAFVKNLKSDKAFSDLLRRIKAGKATQSDGHLYAERVGECLSKALLSEVRVDVLEDGDIRKDAAESILLDLLGESHEKVQEFAVAVQSAIDEAAGLGIAALPADFPAERILGLAGKLSDPAKPVEQRLAAWLGEPVVNNCEAFFDDFVKKNARIRAEMGLVTKINRKADGGCCKWCSGLAGDYDYTTAPKDVYRRHEACRCVTTFTSERPRPGFHVRARWSTPDELAARKAEGKWAESAQNGLLSQIAQKVLETP